MPEGGVVPMGIMKYEYSEILLNKHNSEIVINDSKHINVQFNFIHFS